ncbi:unnamed protein product [Durusdinium trenchii]|uniref:Uncharacterized protein n=1 Tax=Durusdinium trenchii TaxID=1381693 RepID=A0ABP0Q0Q1_9DINO
MGIRVVKRVSNKARAANVEMPFKKGASTKPASWKTKQKQRMLAGLAFMKAPMARCCQPKILGSRFNFWINSMLSLNRVIVALCTLLFNNAGLKWDKPSDHVELFAGDHAITSGEWEEAIPMDLRYDSQQQDILTDVGFSNMLYQVANLRPGGGLWAAPQSRGSTKRSADSPMGDSSAASVRAGNLMVGRLMVLMLLAYAKRCWWSLEQPCNSLLEGHVLFQELLRFRELAVVRVSTSLGWFGSDSKKPLWIYSSEREMQDINNHADRSLVPPKSTEMVVHYVDSTGKKRVKGGADMTASQSYPRSFGRAYARLRTRHLQTIRRRANEFHRRALRAQGKFDLKHKNKLWMDHANLGPILSFLAKQR